MNRPTKPSKLSRKKVSVEPAQRSALVRDIRNIGRAMSESGIPKHRMTVLQRRQPGRANAERSSHAELCDFHARLPQIMTQAQKGDFAFATYHVGIVRGIAMHMNFVRK